ncbi:MAG: hypothetical protein HY402_07100 [Elusimicrobia bacterium]|nr:hypothetical protein [Elusimicrobiota bacterium]
MAARKEIKEIEARITFLLWRARFQNLLFWTASALSLLSLTLLLLLLLDRRFSLPHGLRLLSGGALWAAAALSAAAVGWHLFGRIRPIWIIQKIQSRFPQMRDHLLHAWLLGREIQEGRLRHVSEELAQKHILETLRRLSELPLQKCLRLPGDWRIFSGWTLALCLPLWLAGRPDSGPRALQRLLAPWRDPTLEELLEISPKDAAVAWGNSVSVSAAWKTPQKTPPELWVRGASGQAPYQKGWETSQETSYAFTFPELTQSLEYWIQWQDLRTRRYQLHPIPAPQFSSLEITLEFPAYTQKEKWKTSAGDLEAPAGTRIEWRGFSEELLRSAFLQVLGGPKKILRHIPSKKGPHLYAASHKLQESAEYSFLLENAWGVSNPHPIRYRMAVLPDQAPQVDLLSPTFEVQIGPRGILPLTVQASDDYGLTEISLVYQRRHPNAHPTSTVLKSLRPSAPRHLLTHLWPLAPLAPSLGEKIDFWIEAKDDRPPAPQTGRSRKNTLLLVDFEETHRQSEATLEKFREKLLETLAEQIAAHDLLAQTLPQLQRLQIPPETLQALQAKQNRATQSLEASRRHLEEGLQALLRDPYLNPAALSEYQAMQQNLQALAQGPLQDLQEALAQRRWPQAQNLQNSLISELEKMALLAEEVLKFQRMRDVLTASHSAELSTQRLSGLLKELAEQSSALSAAQAQELAGLLGHIQKDLQDISRLLQELPQDLPEEFVNRAAADSLELPEMHSLTAGLSAALRAGDFQKAAELARELSRKLQTLKQKLGEAVSQTGLSQTRSVAGSLDSEAQTLRQLIQEQAKTVEAIRAQEEKRLRRLMAAQQDLLEKLEKRQRAVLEKAGGLAPHLIPQNTLDTMRAVEKEFADRQVLHAQLYLDKILQELENQKRTHPKQTPNLDPIQQEEGDILKELQKKLPSPPWRGGEAKEFTQLSQKEQGIEERVRNLHRELQEMTRKTALIPRAFFEKSLQAQEELGRSSQALSQAHSQGGLESAQKALELLEEGSSQLQSAASRRKSLESLAGQSVSTFLPTQGLTPAGGMETGWVKIPEPKPLPSSLREEILKALQEKLPQAYESAVEKYFKKIVE